MPLVLLSALFLPTVLLCQTDDDIFEYRSVTQAPIFTAHIGDCVHLYGDDVWGDWPLHFVSRRSRVIVDDLNAADGAIVFDGAGDQCLTLIYNNLTTLPYDYGHAGYEAALFHENAFAHTTDPATLVGVVKASEEIELHWTLDKRRNHYSGSTSDPDSSLAGYQVHYRELPSGNWTLLTQFLYGTLPDHGSTTFENLGSSVRDFEFCVYSVSG